MKASDLKELGFDDKEAKVYLAAIDAGNSTALEISERANIPKSTAHDVLKGLVKKGFVSTYRKKNRKMFSVTDPSILEEKTKRKQEIVERILPELESRYLTHNQRPRVRYYESRKGVDVATQEMVEDTKEMIFISAAVSFYNTFSEYVPVIANARVKNNIWARALVVDEPGIEEWRSKDQKNLRETRLLPEGVDFGAMLWVWKNKVIFFNTTDYFSTLIVEDKHIADMHQKLFNLLWKVSK